MLILFDHENISTKKYYRNVKQEVISEFGYYKWAEADKVGAAQSMMLSTAHTKSWNDNIKFYWCENAKGLEVADEKLIEIACKYRGNTIILVSSDYKLYDRMQQEVQNALVRRGASKSKLRRVKIELYDKFRLGI